jgi:2-oxo-4-hydroxy-4-carboxy-5-ureidoimidazoline decarboxylase
MPDITDRVPALEGPFLEFAQASREQRMTQAVGTHGIAGVGRLPLDAFVARLGNVFEHSPWVAQAAWRQRPFAASMLQAVREASPAQHLALLRAHPELAGREAQAGTLTEASDSEQLSAGLKSLRPDELARMAALNAAYLGKHGFPFIVCVRHYTKAGIFHEMARRSAHDTPREMVEALDQVAAITRLRLGALFPAD